MSGELTAKALATLLTMGAAPASRLATDGAAIVAPSQVRIETDHPGVCLEMKVDVEFGSDGLRIWVGRNQGPQVVQNYWRFDTIIVAVVDCETGESLDPLPEMGPAPVLWQDESVPLTIPGTAELLEVGSSSNEGVPIYIRNIEEEP